MFRCNPNPCEHGGICMQDSKDFYCECEHTGYAGWSLFVLLSSYIPELSNPRMLTFKFQNNIEI